MKKIITSFTKNELDLKNHVVMGPMRRSRATANVPNDLMAEYYGQRSGAGLIITEGTAPMPEALGLPRIPGIYTDEQVEAWKKITTRVHQRDSKIFLQLQHPGRIAHTNNLPDGVLPVGPSTIEAKGKIGTDSHGLQPQTSPLALTKCGIKNIITGFEQAAKNAMAAGFDGVEINGANGYLIEQFLNPYVNIRTDKYGESIIDRTRFAVKIVQAVSNVIGSDRTGIQLSPFSTRGDLKLYDEEKVHQTYTHLAQTMEEEDVAYIHLNINEKVPQQTFESIRKNYSGVIILRNRFTPEKAEQKLDEKLTDLVAFTHLFVANPDLVARIRRDAPLNEIDFDTLYTPGETGYTDYPKRTDITKLPYYHFWLVGDT